MGHEEHAKPRNPHEDHWVTFVMFSPLLMIAVVYVVVWIFA